MNGFSSDEAILPRRLAVVPMPAAGESLVSWVIRLGEDSEVGYLQARELLGLTDEREATRWGSWLTDQEVRGVVAATGLSPDAIEEMLLRRYGGSLTARSWRQGTLFPPGPSARPWWWRPAGFSAVCPKCVAEEPIVWKTVWQLMVTVACPTHNIYLQGWCPACRRPIRLVQSARSKEICLGPVGPMRYKFSQHPCNAAFADMPHIPVRDKRIWDVQSELTTRLAGHPAGHAAAYDRFLDVYRVMLRLLVHLGHPDELGRQADPALRDGFTVFQQVRDRAALTGKVTSAYPDRANQLYLEVRDFLPGPMLMAAVLLISKKVLEGFDDSMAGLTDFLTSCGASTGHQRLLYRRAISCSASLRKEVAEIVGRPLPARLRNEEFPYGEIQELDRMLSGSGRHGLIVALGESPVPPM